MRLLKGFGLALSMEEDFQLIKENFKAQIGRITLPVENILNGKEGWLLILKQNLWMQQK